MTESVLEYRKCLFGRQVLKKQISFIGAGNMAGALIGGIGERVCVYDKNPAQYEKFGGRDLIFAESIADAAARGDYVFLCVKPQNFDVVLGELAACDLSGKVIVSIAAGITVKRISAALGAVPVVRCIPNTPMMIGRGVTGICRNELVSDKVFSDVCRIFGSLGEVVALREDQINAMTAATSSAPAYVFLFIKSIADSARRLGIDDARMPEYVAKMVSGSAELMLRSGKSADELIAQVTSPKGTTAEAMAVFDKRDFAGIIDEAMDACEKRAAELAGE